MPLFIKRINTLLYADDATISTSGKRIVDIENTLFDSGTSAHDWCHKNDMILSLPKCNTDHFQQKKQPSTLNVDIDSTIIPNLSTTRILGVLFDNVISWDEHIKAIRNKITKNLYLLQQIKSFLPVNTWKLFVNSYILPHADFCCVVWGDCSITLVTFLEKRSIKRHGHKCCFKELDQGSLTSILIFIVGFILVLRHVYFKCSCITISEM